MTISQFGSIFWGFGGLISITVGGALFMGVSGALIAYGVGSLIIWHGDKTE